MSGNIRHPPEAMTMKMISWKNATTTMKPNTRKENRASQKDTTNGAKRTMTRIYNPIKTFIEVFNKTSRPLGTGKKSQ